MKAAQYRFTLIGRNTRTAIADVNFCGSSGLPDGNTNTPVFRGVADGVIDQIADQDAQPFGLATHGAGFVGIQFKVDVLAQYLRPQISTNGFGKLCQVNCLRVGQAGFRI